MSETTASADLKSSVKNLVGKLDDIIKEAKAEKYDKTAKAAADVKAMFIKAITSDPKPETVKFYEEKLAPLGKIREVDVKAAASRESIAVKEGELLETEFANLLKKAKADGASEIAKKIEKAKLDFSAEMSGAPSHDLVKEYRTTFQDLSDSLKGAEDAESEEEDDAGDGPCTIRDKKFILSDLDQTPDLKKKYQEWLKDAKAKGPRSANKKHGFKPTAMTGGVMHFRLNGSLRVYYLKDGNELTISGPKHQ